MNRRQLLALPLVMTVPSSPKRTTYDLRSAEDRQQFIQYANQVGHPFPANAFDNCFQLFAGPPTAVETSGVDVLVPQEMARSVWRYRDAAGIPRVRALNG